MKTTGQVGLALLAIIGLVAGVTYLSHYGPGAGTEAKSTTTPANHVLPPTSSGEEQILGFANPHLIFDPETEGEVEVASKGFHDFWYRNLIDQKILVGLMGKNCKCESVDLMALEEAQLPAFQRWSGCSSAMIVAGLHQGILSTVCNLVNESAATPKLHGAPQEWQRLEMSDDNKGILLPPKAGGLVRVRFEGKKDLVGRFRVIVELWAQQEGASKSRRSYGTLEMPISYVAPILYSNNQVNLESLNAGDVRTGEVFVYSKTRADFEVHARLASPDPLVAVAVEDMTGDEAAALVTNHRFYETRILAAKRINVTVHERLSDTQRLDVGPFYRKILLSSMGDEADEYSVVVGGTVRGEVIVGSSDDRGRLELKSFRSKQGASKSIGILADKPNLDLEADKYRVFPESLQPFVKVRLEKRESIGSERRNRWQLHLTVEPGFPPGKLPEGSAVYLNIAGTNPPRQVRIPINGVAYQ